MALSEGHCTTLKPAIKDFRNSLEHASAFLRWDRNLIDVLSMDICERSTARKTFELLDGADANNFFSIIRNPDRDWVTPVPIS